MAGVTLAGFETRRFNEIIAGQRENARTIFQDLVQPGEEVDVSDNSTIGRFIGLVAPSQDDLWQAALEVYQAFDINSATGVPLDNLTALGGIPRLSEQFTRCDVYLTGLIATDVPAGAVVKSSVTNLNYVIQNPIAFNNTGAVGVGVTVKAITPDDYVVRYRAVGTTEYTQIVAKPVMPVTVEGVYEAIETEVANGHSKLKTYRDSTNTLFIQSSQELQSFDFTTYDNLIISQSVKLSVVVAAESGSTGEAVGDIDTIATPMYGWNAVTNPVAATPGRLRETDEELRERFRNTRFDRSTNIIESLYSALYSLQGMSTVVIYENDTDVVDSMGLPPHSFMVLIDGANPSDIGLAIWQNRPAGITSVGNTDVYIVDRYGFSRKISFSRPNEVPVYIELKLTTGDAFPADGEDRIKDALVDYINRLNISNSVVYSRLYTPINSVPGHQIDSLRIGTDPGALSTDNITLTYDQIPKTTKNRIVFI